MSYPFINELKMRIKDETLDFSMEQIQKIGYQVIDLVAEHFESIKLEKKPPSPKITPKEIADLLSSSLPLDGEDPFDILNECQEKIIPYSTNMGHARFFGYIPNTTAILPIYADSLVSALNQNLAVWIASPAATIIERLVLSWIKEIVGIHNGAEGLLTTGGSMATLIALNVARYAKCPWDISKEGMIHPMTLYVSEEAHSCIRKSVELLGIGTDNLRLIETNDFKINLTALTKTIEKDLNNPKIHPFCIIGNAGTVNTGTIDPLNELAKIAKQYNLWYHIDGAYGGFAALTSEGKTLLNGIECADSLTLDPHKWLFVPIETGCILVREGSHLQQAFSRLPPYILDYRSKQDALAERHNFHEYGFQMTRRFRGLRIWVALKHHGLNKYARIIQQNILLAQYLALLVQQSSKLQLLADVELSICCFRYVPPEIDLKAMKASCLLKKNWDILNKNILETLNKGGKAFLSSTILNGQFALRACISGYRTGKNDIELLVQTIETIGDTLYTL